MKHCVIQHDTMEYPKFFLIFYNQNSTLTNENQKRLNCRMLTNDFQEIR